MKHLTNRQKQAAETRKKLFDCAQDLFTSYSYEKVKITDICRAAGVSVGAFYHHFPNKESILNEGYRQFDYQLKYLWEEHASTSHRDAIWFLIKVQLDSITQKGPAGALQFFKNQLSNEEKYILEISRFFYQTLLSEVQAEINSTGIEGDAKEITDTILRTSRGVIYDWCLRDGSYDIISVGKRSLDMVLSFYQAK